ncbi:HAD family hydrolase [Pseudonocardia sp. Cha107L01]|uniref:HAD family hydrolase n=1 Tax=Pseudonocardia sp. Cha107L01 TaxID=3457576 RepID=UPI00403E536F
MSLADVLAHSKHILLDFDGPMCATFSAISSAEATRELGNILARHEVRVPAYLLDTADPFALLYYVAINVPQHSAMIEQALTALEVAGVKSAQPTAGLRDLLGALTRTDRTVTVVSNNSAAAVADFVKAEDLGGYIHGIVARTDPDPRLLKPDPHLLLQAAAALGAPPAICALLGDSVTDVEAARRAGTGSIAFANKPDKRDPLLAASPNALISSLRDVANALAS